MPAASLIFSASLTSPPEISSARSSPPLDPYLCRYIVLALAPHMFDEIPLRIIFLVMLQVLLILCYLKAFDALIASVGLRRTWKVPDWKGLVFGNCGIWEGRICFKFCWNCWECDWYCLQLLWNEWDPMCKKGILWQIVQLGKFPPRAISLWTLSTGIFTGIGLELDCLALFGNFWGAVYVYVFVSFFIDGSMKSIWLEVMMSYSLFHVNRGFDIWTCSRIEFISRFCMGKALVVVVMVILEDC